VEWRGYLTRQKPTKTPVQQGDRTVWTRRAARFTCSHPAAAPLISLPIYSPRDTIGTILIFY
jgi:hypothetical protein